MPGRTTTERTGFPPWLGCALAVLFVLNVAAAVAVLRPPQFATVLDPAQIRPELGVAWTAPVPLGNFVFNADGDRGVPLTSKLRLFEDHIELKPGRSLVADIQEKGSGRFLHWHRWIYFSTPDGTDPRNNGRTYSVSVTGGLSTNLLVALALLNLILFAVLRRVLIRRYGGSTAGVRSSESAPTLSPLALAALATAAAFSLAWFCGLTYRTNDDVDMRMVAEGIVTGRPSEFLIYQNVIAGLALRALYGAAPHVPWYDLALAAGSIAGALMLLTALLRLCGSQRALILCALIGLIVFADIFQNFQFTAAATVLAGGATALLASVAFRPPASPRRLRLCVAAAAAAFFWGSLFRFEAAFLAAALVAPILLLWMRQSMAALRLPILGLAAGIALAGSGKAFDLVYYHLAPGWEHVQAEKRQRLRVAEYLHADLSRVPEINAALSAVGWSRNDYDLISSKIAAVPDTFRTERVVRFAELAPRKSWSERIATFHQTIQPARHTVWLFVALGVLALVMARSFYALAVLLVSAAWFSVLLIALAIAYKPWFLHLLWVTGGTALLVATATALAAAPRIQRQGYHFIEDKMIAAGVFAAVCIGALWQLHSMWASERPRDELRAPLARDLAAWPAAPNTTVVSWGADFPLETWVRPFHAIARYGWRFLRTTHTSGTPLADPIYAAWGTRDILWSLCHIPGTYLVDGRRGYVVRQAPMLSTYMRERHAEAVALVPVFKGEATSLLACRPAETEN